MVRVPQAEGNVPRVERSDSPDKGWASQLGTRHGTREVGGNQFIYKEFKLRMFQAHTLILGIPFQ